MHILITGGAGYIGSHMSWLLHENTSHTITVLDNLVAGHEEALPNVSFVKVDLGDSEKIENLLAQEQFDAIIHFAAHIVVSESVGDPLKYYLNNTLNTTCLIDSAIRHGVRSFIFSSTAAVYGMSEVSPITEDSPLQPINPYGWSKLMSEQVLRDAGRAHPEFRYAIIRYFNVAGCHPGFHIGESHDPETHLIPLVAQSALEKRKEFHVYGDDYDTPDGSCIRDYVHVMDLVQAHLMALDYLASGEDSLTVNCGYGHGYSVKEVVETMKEVSGEDFSVRVKPRRPGDPDRLVASHDKIRSILGWEPRFDDLKTICQHALEWEKRRTF